MCARHDIKINQGATYTLVFQIIQADGGPRDLSEYGIRAQLRPRHDSETAQDFTATIIDPPRGLCQISLTAEQTEALWPGTAVYDVEIYRDEFVARELEGDVIISPEVTR